MTQKPPTSEDPREFDLTQVKFPSDQIALGRLRQAHPEAFDRWQEEGNFSGSEAANAVSYLLYCERHYFYYLLDEALCTDLPEEAKPLWEETKQLKVRQLTEAYQRYGLANGPHEAAELVRGIERDARTVAAATVRART